MTRFLIYFHKDKFEFETYLTERDRRMLPEDKRNLKDQFVQRFKIFIYNNFFNPSEKVLEIKLFEKELNEIWNELNVDSVLFKEFQDIITDFYIQKKKKIKDSLFHKIKQNS